MESVIRDFCKSMLKSALNHSLAPIMGGSPTVVIDTDVFGEFSQPATPETFLVLWHVGAGIDALRLYLPWESTTTSRAKIDGTYLEYYLLSIEDSFTKAGKVMYLPATNNIKIQPDLYNLSNRFTIGRLIRGYLEINSTSTSTLSGAQSGTMVSANVTDTRFMTQFLPEQIMQQSVPGKDAVQKVSVQEGIVWDLGPDWILREAPLRYINNVFPYSSSTNQGTVPFLTSVTPGVQYATGSFVNSFDIFDLVELPPNGYGPPLQNEITSTLLPEAPPGVAGNGELYKNCIWLSPYTQIGSTYLPSPTTMNVKLINDGVTPIGILDAPRVSVDMIVTPSTTDKAQITFFHQFNSRNTDGTVATYQVRETVPYGPVLDMNDGFPAPPPPFPFPELGTPIPPALLAPIDVRISSAPLLPVGHQWVGTLIMLSSNSTTAGIFKITKVYLEGINTLKNGGLPCRVLRVTGMSPQQDLSVSGRFICESEIGFDAVFTRGSMSLAVMDAVKTVMGTIYSSSAYEVRRVWKKGDYIKYNSDKDLDEYFANN